MPGIKTQRASLDFTAFKNLLIGYIINGMLVGLEA